MDDQTEKDRFTWVLDDFSSLHVNEVYSPSFNVAGYDWRLAVNPNGYRNGGWLRVSLELANPVSLPPLWRRQVKVSFTLVNQGLVKSNLVLGGNYSFDATESQGSWNPYGYNQFMVRTQIQLKDEGFLVNDKLVIIADLFVFPEEMTEPLSSKQASDASFGKSLGDSSSKMVQITENAPIDVYGFQVLPSQEESVRRIFQKHPDIALEFRGKNQHLRKACMSFLLSLIETLCQSLEELSTDDLVEADMALTYLKDAGFKVDWLEKKLEQVVEKKQKEESNFAKLKETEDILLKLKQKCAEIDALAEAQKAELSATRTPLSFDDVLI